LERWQPISPQDGVRVSARGRPSTPSTAEHQGAG
jgi:hypothetical protein